MVDKHCEHAIYFYNFNLKRKYVSPVKNTFTYLT